MLSPVRLRMKRRLAILSLLDTALLQNSAFTCQAREPPPHWPRNTLGSPQRKRVFPGIGNTGNLPWKCDPIPDKQMKMDGWMDDGNLRCLCDHHYKIVKMCVTLVELLKACLSVCMLTSLILQVWFFRHCFRDIQPLTYSAHPTD